MWSFLPSLGFWLSVGILTLVSSCSFAQRFKIQKNRKPDAKLVRRATAATLCEHIVVRPLLFAFVLYPLCTYRNVGPLFTRPIPSLFTMAWQICVFAFIDDSMNYWVHRLLHTVPFLYQTIHKRHHEITVSDAILAEYFHPLDSLLTGAFPIAAGPLLLACHEVTFNVWVLIRVLEGVLIHSGYNYPFLPFYCCDSLFGLIEW